MELRPYQQEVVERGTPILFDSNLLYLCLECRLGKTFVSLSIAERMGVGRVLFVTKKKAIPSILADYRFMKATRPFLFDICVVNPENIVATFKKAEKAATEVLDKTCPLISRKGVKYKKMHAEMCEHQRSLLAPYLDPSNIDLVIIDEAHSYGSLPKPSLAQQCLREICEDKRIIFLSGTPSPENYSQLYHQFQISTYTPFAAYPSFYKWAHKFVDIEQKMINGMPHADYTHARIEDIEPYIAPLMITMTQEEAGFSTEIEEHVEVIKMSRLTSNLIKTIKRARVIPKNPYLSNDVVADTPVSLLQKLHQLGSGTIKYEDGKVSILDYTKAVAIKDYFKDKHIAITYVYQAELALLQEVFKYRWTTSPEEFQSDPTKVFLGQVRSIREGIRLDTADAFVFYNLEWSYTSYAQARQRIVSKERKGAAPVYFFFSDCGIERKIFEALQGKESFSTSWYFKHQD